MPSRALGDWLLNLKSVARDWLPPAVLRTLKRILPKESQRPDWDYCPDGWRTVDPLIKGWNAEGVVSAQLRSWPAYLEVLKGVGPLGVSHTDLVPNGHSPSFHNTIMSFAYVLGLSARTKDRISILDWGGGLGHYGPLSRALLPEVAIDYFCKDLPLICRAGREALPDATFFERDEQLDGKSFDLVLSSSSLHYSEDWRDVAGRLATAASGHLYITRLPIVDRAGSFVVVQRPYGCGYDTEYLGWFLNRGELLDLMAGLNLELLREFLIDEHPDVPNAPEQAHYRGFLFRSRAGASPQDAIP